MQGNTKPRDILKALHAFQENFKNIRSPEIEQKVIDEGHKILNKIFDFINDEIKNFRSLDSVNDKDVYIFRENLAVGIFCDHIDLRTKFFKEAKLNSMAYLFNEVEEALED